MQIYFWLINFLLAGKYGVTRIMPRVFISFASVGADLANRLHATLTERGATVFQFQQTARAGQEAWDQVYNNIRTADYFICLLCRDAMKSRAVKKEIGYADHRNTNQQGRPELVPVLLDNLDPLKWPAALQVLTPIDVSDPYAAGRTNACANKIADALGLEPDREPDPAVQKNAEIKEQEQNETETAFAEPAVASEGTLDVSDRTMPGADSAAIARIEADYGGFEWERIWYALVILIVGAILSVGTILLSAVGFDFLWNYIDLAVEKSGLIDAIFFWVATSPWFQWVSGLLFGAGIIVWTLMTAGDEVPLDTPEYAFVTLKSAIAAFIVGIAWALLHYGLFDSEMLAGIVGGAVMLSAVTTAIYALIEG